MCFKNEKGSEVVGHQTTKPLGTPNNHHQDGCSMIRPPSPTQRTLEASWSRVHPSFFQSFESCRFAKANPFLCTSWSLKSITRAKIDTKIIVYIAEMAEVSYMSRVCHTWPTASVTCMLMLTRWSMTNPTPVDM